MISICQPCRYYGSRRGCRYEAQCPYDHSQPNSVPLCRLGDACVYGAECIFRDETSSVLNPDPTPRRTLLDYTPPAINNLIFASKLEMERLELSEKLNWKYQRQLEFLMLKDRKNTGNGDTKQKIESKYGKRFTLEINAYPLNFFTKARITISSADSRKKIKMAGDVLERNNLDLMAIVAHNKIRAYQFIKIATDGGLYSGEERIKIKVSKMPYRFENGNMVADGILVLDLKLCDEPCFIPMTKYLPPIGFRVESPPIDRAVECPDCYLGIDHECQGLDMYGTPPPYWS